MGERHLELVDAGPDGVCGAETADGTPCQRPAGDDGTCWEPSHRPPDQKGTHLPQPPKHLGEIGQRNWRHHVKRLDAYGVLDRADTTVVEKAAELYEIGRLLHTDIRKSGSRVPARDGTKKKNPSVAKLKEFSTEYRQYTKQIDGWIEMGELQDDREEPDDPLARGW